MTTRILLILFLALLTATAHRALALAGTLDRPSIAFPQSVEDGWRESVTRALETEGARFLDGNFINANTTLRYGGNTDSLSRFLDRLARCNGLKLRIRFDSKLDAVWTVQHNAWIDSTAFEVRISPDSIQLAELVLPEIVGSSASKQPAPFLKTP
jgi:hypothetical protein